MNKVYFFQALHKSEMVKALLFSNRNILHLRGTNSSTHSPVAICGTILGELVLATGVFACWLAGIILSWEVYKSTKALFKLSKHKYDHKK